MKNESDVAMIAPLDRFLVPPEPHSPKINDLLQQMLLVDQQLVVNSLESRKFEDALGNNTFFAFENVRGVLQPKIETLRNTKMQLVERQKELKRLISTQEIVSLGFPLVDYSPLGWINQHTHLPVFFILNIKHQSVTAQYDVRRGQVYNYSLFGGQNSSSYPAKIESLYHEAAIKAAEFDINDSNQQKSYSLSFHGTVPIETRYKINNARNHFEEIFIIGEAKTWQINVTDNSQGNPLVVGWKSTIEKMFFIDTFSPISLDSYFQEQSLTQ